MKNLFKVLLVLLLSVSLFSCTTTENTDVQVTANPDEVSESSDESTSQEIEAEEVTIQIKVINKDDGDTIVFDDEVTSEIPSESSLADFLTDQTAFDVTLSEGAYGLQIDKIAGLVADMTSGPYIVYDSSNNKQCLEAGFCDGVSNLIVEDGDSFTFTYTSTFE